MQLLIASLLTVPSLSEIDLDIYQDKANGIYLWEDSSRKTTPASKIRFKEIEVDGQSPEAITASQRACEVRIRDWS